MSTLSNVTTCRAGISTHCTGFAYSAPSDIAHNGVSVKYAFDECRKWFVLRVTYNRIDKALERFEQSKTDIYFPQHYTLKLVNGKKRRVLEPLLPNIIFVYTTEDYIDKVVKESNEKEAGKKHKTISYYLDHFAKNEKGNNPPLTIRYDEMMNFIRATATGNEHVMVVTPEQCHYKSGDYVEITEGEFVGIKGRVARVAGQQRVIIEVEGLCMIATAYIPSAFLKLISED